MLWSFDLAVQGPGQYYRVAYLQVPVVHRGNIIGTIAQQV